jgi:dTDP-4-dehydrorhamnose reductase
VSAGPGTSRSALLIGGDSEIGAATGQHLNNLGYKVLSTTRRRDRMAANRPFLDLSAPLDNWQPPDNTDVACIFAAIARLQDCAADPRGTSLINVTRTVALVDRLLAHDMHIVFLSTDKVFDGTQPAVPADTPTKPVCEYGRQKAATEAELQQRMAVGKPVAILRLAKVVSPGMPLLKQWMAALAAGQTVRAFGDMMLAPVPVMIVASAIERLIAERTNGIFQLTGPRDVSYAELARYTAHKLDADARLVVTGSATAAGLPAGSTARHTALDTTALRERFGIVVPDVWSVVDELIETCRP